MAQFDDEISEIQKKLNELSEFANAEERPKYICEHCGYTIRGRDVIMYNNMYMHIKCREERQVTRERILAHEHEIPLEKSFEDVKEVGDAKRNRVKRMLQERYFSRSTQFLNSLKEDTMLMAEQSAGHEVALATIQGLNDRIRELENALQATKDALARAWKELPPTTIIVKKPYEVRGSRVTCVECGEKTTWRDIHGIAKHAVCPPKPTTIKTIREAAERAAFKYLEIEDVD